MDADIAERLKQCRIFFRKGKDWTDAEELTAARVFQDFRDFLINERERPYAWCAFQQTEEALAMLLSVEGLMTVCDSTWTQADAEQEFRPQLEQTVQADGVIDLFEKDSVEISLFDEAFLQEYDSSFRPLPEPGS